MKQTFRRAWCGCMRHECNLPPVSPMCSMMAASEPPPTDHGTASGSAPVEAREERVDPKHARLGEPIIGNEGVLLDEHGPGARLPEVMPAPKGMTAAESARHIITHLPYCANCPWCVASRRPNTQHRSTNNSDRQIPLRVADYCFQRAAPATIMQLC